MTLWVAKGTQASGLAESSKGDNNIKRSTWFHAGFKTVGPVS